MRESGQFCPFQQWDQSGLSYLVLAISLLTEDKEPHKSITNHCMDKTLKKHTPYLHKHHQSELSHMATYSCKRGYGMKSLIGWPYAQLIFYYHGRK